MNIARTIGYLLLAGIVTLVLFRVRFVFDFALPQDIEVADPAIEAAFESCYREQDHDIHVAAFGTIDNPDVQKEYISSNRARAERDCRSRHPAKKMTVAAPFRFNLVDLEPRFW